MFSVLSPGSIGSAISSPDMNWDDTSPGAAQYIFLPLDAHPVRAQLPRERLDRPLRQTPAQHKLSVSAERARKRQHEAQRRAALAAVKAARAAIRVEQRAQTRQCRADILRASRVFHPHRVPCQRSADKVPVRLGF